jgi:peptide/nickel transport system substrate-binding protein
MQRRKRAAGFVAVAGALMLAAACGGGSGGKGGGGGGSAKKALVIGTTDAGVTTVDPAGSYDLPSSTIQYNVFQLLMKIPPGGNKPVPDAAQSCDFTDPKTYKCTLKSGLKFSNGDPLTSQDVKFSYDRLIAINDPNGTASAIYGTAGKGGKADPEATVEAPDPTTVIFHLKAPDATWPVKLTYSAAGIVDHTVFPADKKLDDTKVIGSGPYKLTKGPAGGLRGQPELCRRHQGQGAKRDRPVLPAVVRAQAGDRAGRSRRRLPQPVAHRVQGAAGRVQQGRQRRGRQRHRDPLPRLQRKQAPLQ